MRVLSEPLQKFAETLRGIHKFQPPVGTDATDEYREMQERRRLTTEHPIVRIHPETKEKVLYVSPSFLKIRGSHRAKANKYWKFFGSMRSGRNSPSASNGRATISLCGITGLSCTAHLVTFTNRISIVSSIRRCSAMYRLAQTAANPVSIQGIRLFPVSRASGVMIDRKNRRVTSDWNCRAESSFYHPGTGTGEPGFEYLSKVV